MSSKKNKKRILAIGLMSGTSMDGLDAVLIEASRFALEKIENIKILNHEYRRFPATWKRAMSKIADDNLLLESHMFGVAFSEWTFEVVQKLCRRSKENLQNIAAIGFHGQTIYHIPKAKRFLGKNSGISIQLADLSRLSYLAGVPVVGRFRLADIAAGGQGAPLAPHGHRFLFGQKGKNIAVQNLGGISNTTVLRNGSVQMGFDTGPANMWMDWTVQHLTKGKRKYDAEGKMASRGTIDARFLALLKRHPYFRKVPPKSTGWEDFGHPYMKKHARRIRRIGMENSLATLVEATAWSIGYSLKRFALAKQSIDELIVCGGGALNPFLLERIQHHIKPVFLRTSAEYGIPPNQVEAASFAILALQALGSTSSNEPLATGAKKAVVCGEIANPHGLKLTV